MNEHPVVPLLQRCAVFVFGLFEGASGIELVRRLLLALRHLGADSERHLAQIAASRLVKLFRQVDHFSRFLFERAANIFQDRLAARCVFRSVEL